MPASKYFADLAARRTIYALGRDNFPYTVPQLTEFTRHIVALTPTSFNSQTTRAIVVGPQGHTKLWGTFAHDALKAVTPEDTFAATASKLKAFEAGFGTVLFFEDQAAIKKLQDAFPLYAPNFPVWAAQSSGAAQISLWTALSLNEKVGANLQHYSPLIDEAVAKEWNVPEPWKLSAQLVVGTKLSSAGSKDTLPGTETVKEFS